MDVLDITITRDEDGTYTLIDRLTGDTIQGNYRKISRWIERQFESIGEEV